MKQDNVVLVLLIVGFLMQVAVLQFGQIIGEGRVIDVVIQGIAQAVQS